MFGLSFGELVVLLIVAVVVIGPKEMPKVLRKAGSALASSAAWRTTSASRAGSTRCCAARGSAEDIAEIRKLARGEMDNVTRAARIDDRPCRRRRAR